MFLLMDEPNLVDDSAVYMNAEQLAYFNGLLNRKMEETLAAIRDTDLAEREDMSDPLDRAAQDQDREAEARGFERNLTQIRDIEQALKRIEAQEYGYCQDTGEPIGIARLLANPTTLFSVEALRVRESRNRRYGRH